MVRAKLAIIVHGKQPIKSTDNHLKPLSDFGNEKYNADTTMQLICCLKYKDSKTVSQVILKYRDLQVCDTKLI